MALMTWEDSRTNRYHVRKVVLGRRAEQLSRKIKKPSGIVKSGMDSRVCRVKARIPGVTLTRL